MSTIFKILPLFIWLILFQMNVGAQTQLDQYIDFALRNNDGIKQQQFQLDKAMAALEEAKTLFKPSVAFQTTYTRADGGRTFAIPVGDMLNPVYSTLNQLTNTHNFPHLQNQSFLLNPDNFYDAKFHTTMPLINSEIYYNKRMKQQAISLEQASVNVYKRSLVKDIKTAYYQYYQALQAIKIYKSALELVDKNITVNESLYKNGVRNSTSLTRAEAEKHKVMAMITEAENNSKNARAYFNFLLNRGQDEPIAIDSLAEQLVGAENEFNLEASIGHREELQQLGIKKDILQLNTGMEKSYLVPHLNTFLDLGSQAFNWEVNNQSRYYFFGLSLDWNVFAWGQHKYKIQQAALDVNTTEAQIDETEKAFHLQLVQAINNYNTAVSGYQDAISQRTYSEKYYTDQAKAYKEGELLYIELLDAQNQLTLARLQVSLAYAKVQIAKAEAERAQASYPLNNL